MTLSDLTKKLWIINVNFLNLLDKEISTSNRKVDWSHGLRLSTHHQNHIFKMDWSGLQKSEKNRKEIGCFFTSVSYSELEQLVNLDGRDEIRTCTSVVLNNCNEIQSLIINGFYMIHLFQFQSLNWNDQEATRLSIPEYTFSLPTWPQVH